MDSKDKKLEKRSRRDYRRAVDKIVTDQVNTFMREMRRQRNIFRLIAAFSIPLNIILAVILAIVWKA